MVHERIREFIKQSGLTKACVAKRSHLSGARLKDILSGKRQLTADEYYAICRALNQPLDRFQPGEKQQGREENGVCI
jgi:transcriptional regulator with XRE-family HTH domain